MHPGALRTAVFYNWENRGRGWQLWPHPVVLEPPFVPLAYCYPEPITPRDDARHHTFISGLIQRTKNAWTSTPEDQEKSSVDSDDSESSQWDLDEEPSLFDPADDYHPLQIVMPRDYQGQIQAYKNLIQSLHYTAHPIGFEIIASADVITVQIGTWSDDLHTLRDQIRAHTPEATPLEEPDVLCSLWQEDLTTMVVDFGLESETMLPLRTFSDFRHDPFSALTGAMAELEDQECAVFQVLFTPVRSPWDTHLKAAVLDCDGSAFFADAPEMVPLAKEKVSSPLFACALRIGVSADDCDRVWSLIKPLGGALSQYGVPGSNRLMPLSNDGFDDAVHWEDVLLRRSHRSGMLLSLNELVGFVHLPGQNVVSEKLKRKRQKTKAAPALSLGHTLELGRNTHRGKSVSVTLSPDQRTRHMYVVGASGTGKSTLLLNCIRQDIENGQGIGVLDPHGDLTDQILDLVPEERIKDVVLLDPSDEEYPVGLNILHAHSNLEKTLLASDLTAVFQRLSTSWGDQMNSVLANGILAILESTQGGTLLDLRRFLVEKDFRHQFLESVVDPEVVYYWTKEFPMLSGRPQASVLTRLDTFLRPKPIRYMVCQNKSTIDFADIMDTSKIFLAKLAHGGIGEENAYLLGALLASKIHQTALSRQSISQDKRKHFWLYIDEFQNFVTPSIAQTLSGARKYNLGLILAHQELAQLSTQDRGVAASVIANPYTRICFRLGDRDARTLAEGFSTFDAHDLQSLGIGAAVGRIEQAAHDFSLATEFLPRLESQETDMQRDAIIRASRERYGTPRAVVEVLFTDSHGDVEQRNESTKADNDSAESDTKVDTGGRGGTKHKEIQKMIQELAQERGFGATIEYATKDGGYVDVAVTTPNSRIACEISITTSPEHEYKNILKCLADGFDRVVVIATNGNACDKIVDFAKRELSDSEMNRAYFCRPEELERYFGKHSGGINKSKVRGYQINIVNKKSTTKDTVARLRRIGDIVGE